VRIGLAVGFFDPQVGGSEEVVKRLALGLRDRGHDVLVATSVHPARRPDRMVVPVHGFEVAGNTASGIRGDVIGYQEFLRTTARDVWLFYAAQIWSTDLALPLLGALEAKTVVVPCGYSGLGLPHFRSYFEHLPAALKRADALVYMSRSYQDWEHDQASGLGHLAHVIPNGAADEEFAEIGPPSGRDRAQRGHTVITVANHLPGKGHDAVVKAFRAAAGRHDRLVIIGGRPTSSAEPTCWRSCRMAAMRDRRITLAEGLARDEVVAAYRTADVFLFGSEVECAPLVLVESMAAGLPFVSTPVGNAEDLADAGVVCPPDELADGLARLLSAPSLRASLGQRGRERWDAEHRWSRVIDKYEALFAELTRRRVRVEVSA
jgi:glycosyltransferase involved in cell wall biosynthesis